MASKYGAAEASTEKWVMWEIKSEDRKEEPRAEIIAGA
jgi:hypothetical protein